MKKQKRVDINLASHPVRNRRFFFLLSGILGVIILVISSIGGYTYLTYSTKYKNLMQNNAQIESKIKETQRETLRLSTQIEEASQSYQRRVDLLNSLIIKKSFSWMEFLSALEDALPASCYIESLAPTLKENNQMEVRLKIAAPGLDDLLLLNQNLYKKNFKGIRIVSESISDGGLLIGEITLNYERTS